MNKKILVILAVITLFAVPMSTTFAGTAGPVSTPNWYNCVNQYVSVGSTGKAYAGTSNVLVAWLAPTEDYETVFCTAHAFSLMQFSVQIYHQGIASASGPTFQSSASVGSITVSVVYVVERCTKYGCITQNYPYILKTGDGVCVNEAVWYGVYDEHSGGYCYYV